MAEDFVLDSSVVDSYATSDNNVQAEANGDAIDVSIMGDEYGSSKDSRWTETDAGTVYYDEAGGVARFSDPADPFIGETNAAIDQFAELPSGRNFIAEYKYVRDPNGGFSDANAKVELFLMMAETAVPKFLYAKVQSDRQGASMRHQIWGYYYNGVANNLLGTTTSATETDFDDFLFRLEVSSDGDTVAVRYNKDGAGWTTFGTLSGQDAATLAARILGIFRNLSQAEMHAAQIDYFRMISGGVYWDNTLATTLLVDTSGLFDFSTIADEYTGDVKGRYKLASGDSFSGGLLSLEDIATALGQSEVDDQFGLELYFNDNDSNAAASFGPVTISAIATGGGIGLINGGLIR